MFSRRVDALDYSFARPSPQGIAAAGIDTVIRYLYPDFPGSKGMTRAEVDALHAAGISVVLNYEDETGNALRGPGQGVVDARNALALARDLGAPEGLPIYISCDREITRAQLPIVGGYYMAARTVLDGHYETRAYAQASVCDYLGDNGICLNNWQTYAWSYGAESRHAALYQWRNSQDFDGHAVDHNAVIDRANLGAWRPGQEAADDMSKQDALDALGEFNFAEFKTWISAAMAESNKNVANAAETSSKRWAQLMHAGLTAQLAAEDAQDDLDIAALADALRSKLTAPQVEALTLTLAAS